MEDFVKTASVIFSLIILEGLLSVDNALVNAGCASNLHGKEKKLAITIGIGGGAVLRLFALFFASYIIKFSWVKIAGGGYLIGMAVKHFFFVKEKAHGTKSDSFWGVIFQIIIADGIFSIDNILSAVAMSKDIVIISIGVLAGIMTMLFVTQLISKVMDKFPILKNTAFIIVGIVGGFLIFEEVSSHEIHEWIKFSVIILTVLGAMGIEQINTLRRAS